MKIHLIVTCTKQKTLMAGDTIFPEERDAARAYGAWLERLEKAGNDHPSVTAGELYTGQHWSRAIAAAARTRAELWIISAGLGFLHVTDPVVPYEATFADMPFSHREIWTHLTARPPTARYCPSLASLMQENPADRYVVAASPVYLRAVESDLHAGREALCSPQQLSIVTSKGYKGNLKGNVKYTSAKMMKALNTNMTGLNISYALQLIGNEKLNSRKANEVYA